MNNRPYKLQKQYRLPAWDYSKPGYYFVTICTKDRWEILGKIKNNECYCSSIGKIIKNIWYKIPIQFNNVNLDKLIIMPNHLHGIIRIIRRNLINQISTDNKIKNNPMTTKYLTLGGIIRWFKGKITFTVRKQISQHETVWQSRFYDRIIRSDEELHRIREYIDLNPLYWHDDINNIPNSYSEILH